MKKIALRLIAIAAVLCAGILVSAILTADKTKFHNDFVRIIPPHAADLYRAVEFQSGNIAIAGISDKTIFITSNNRLFTLSADMVDTATLPMKKPFGFELLIDSPFFFIQSGSSATLQRGRIDSWEIDRTFSQLPGFTAFQPISANTAVLRTINLNVRKNLLVRSDEAETPRDILTKQVDGVLCTDGFLDYSKELRLLVYTYRYRNEFISIDTNLNVVRRGHTIDTTTVAKIGVTETSGKITMSKPPFVVNKATSVSGRYLFVNSNLVAKNEPPEIVNDRSIVDVYDLSNGAYRYSFYVFDYMHSRMESFKVKDSILIATFRNHVVRYDLPSAHRR